MAIDLLSRIVRWTREDVCRRKVQVSFREIEEQAQKMPSPKNFAEALWQNGFGLIAEIKVKSPSLGQMRQENVEEAPRIYNTHPLVRAVSVLTSKKFFGMGTEDLHRLRTQIQKPILCKDFIVEEYQIAEARVAGADAVLLMAHVLDKETLSRLLNYCHGIGMEALVENRNEEEINRIPVNARVVGINSRKLDSSGFSPRYAISRLIGRDCSPVRGRFELIKHLPENMVKVAESGISASSIGSVRDQGWNAALIGSSILRDPRGVKSCLDEMQSALAAAVESHSSDARSLNPHFA